jgi:tetratricopeptide (TPR) repeat protein
VLGDLRGAGYSLNNLGLMAQANGQQEEAAQWYEEALSLFRQTGEKRGISVVLPGLSVVAYAQGDLETARRLAEEALHLHREMGEARAIAQRLDALGRLARLTGDPDRARSLHREGLSLFQRIGDRRGMAMALDGFAELVALTGEFIKAVDLFSVASALREAIQAAPDFGGYVDSVPRETTIALLRARLGGGAFTRAWNKGQRLPLSQAVATLLVKEGDEVPARARTRPLQIASDPLTSRERELVRLVAQGRTNREVGEALGARPKSR